MGKGKTHKTKSRKRGPVRSKKVVLDGITFASGLEKYMYLALKKAHIKSEYEGETFILQEGFDFDMESYERQANGKGYFANRELTTVFLLDGKCSSNRLIKQDRM